MKLEGNWIFLRGEEEGIRELAAVLGVKYQKIGDEFNHSNIITILNEKGEIAHQQKGISVNTAETLRALRGE